MKCSEGREGVTIYLSRGAEGQLQQNSRPRANMRTEA